MRTVYFQSSRMARGQDQAWDLAWDVKRQFEKDYPPDQYGKYLCGISKVYLQTAGASEEEASNYCIKVTLTQLLPVNLKFPDKYQEVRVFVTAMNPTAIT